ncbi:hypothetical protein GCM10027040_31550 [Halomonas shantousis]
MTPQALALLLALLLAHLAGDFLLQSSAWVQDKQARRHRSPALYLHAGVHTLLPLGVLLVSRQPIGQAMLAALAIGSAHLLIDTLKSHLAAEKLRYFLLDQLLHLIVLILVWAALFAAWPWLVSVTTTTLVRPDVLLIVVAYTLILRPLSILIALVMRRWSGQIENAGTLADAGARIGMLERFLVLTFVLTDQMMPIGFLLAAKSVLRFGDLREDRDRKLTEYVLLGTMLSFALTLSLGLLVRRGLGVL